MGDPRLQQLLAEWQAADDRAHAYARHADGAPPDGVQAWLAEQFRAVARRRLRKVMAYSDSVRHRIPLL